jgi:cytochrome bd-type quinol oxidase subunit 2
MALHARSGKSPARWAVVTVLLVVAIMGTLWVPIYARSTPKLGPFPFFYWYQLIWVPVSAVLCWICYLLLRSEPRPRGVVPR